MNLEELKKLLAENGELKNELLAELINDESVRKVIDSKVSQGINSFKENGMSKILDEKKDAWKNEHFKEFAEKNGLELNPEIASMKEQLRALTDEINQTKIKEAKASIRGKVISKLASEKLDTKLADFINITNEEETFSQLDAFKGVINSVVEERVKAQLGEKKIVETGKTGITDSNNPFAKETYNLTRQAEILKSDPSKAKELQELATKTKQ